MAENLDERYPAAFQRGYSGEGSGGAAPKAAANSASDAIGTPPGRPVVEQRVSGSVGAVASGQANTNENEPVVEPLVNPFIVVLWILSITFATVGVWLVLWFQMQQNIGYSGSAPPVDYVLMQIAYLLSGPVTTAGLLGILGLLFWHAASWRRRAIARTASGH